MKPSLSRSAAVVFGAVAGAAVVAAARRRPPEELAGRVALVTGGSRGLGYLIARELLDRGCAVAICARDPQELDRAAAKLSARGAVLTVPCDVSDPAAVGAMVRSIETQLGPIGILVNNAGIISVGPEASMTLQDYHRSMDVMYWGVVHCTRAVLPSMKRRRTGRIANITSIGGAVSMPHLVPYSAAKFAAVGFSQGMRAELRSEGILVTTVVPGLMRTGSPVRAWFKGDARAEYAWFSSASATPITAMHADRAARRIVDALARGRAQLVLSWQAKLLRSMHAIAPGLTADALGVVHRLLPQGVASDGRQGMEVDPGAEVNPLLRRLHEAALRNNEYAAVYDGGDGRTM